MNGVAWGAIATLTIFVISNIGLMIHWSAKISTLLEILQKELSQLVDEFKEMRGSYVTKEDLAYRVDSSDKEHKAMWRQIDDLKEHTGNCKNFIPK